MRNSTAFKNLAADWKQQVKYKRHRDFVEEWQEWKEAYGENIKFTDKPDDFLNGHFVHQVFVLLKFIDDADEGELLGFFDYLLDIDN